MNANPRTRAAAVCATALLLAATLFCAALAKGGVSRAWAEDDAVSLATNPVCRIVGGDEYDSLVQAVAAAASGNTIEITASNTVGQAIDAGGKELTLRNADGGAHVTTFSAAGSLTTSGNFTLGACVLDGGSASGTTRTSALITVNGGSFTMDGATVRNVTNTNASTSAANPGGAFGVAAGTLTFASGTIEGCRAASGRNTYDTNGGGSVAHIAPGATLIMQEGTSISGSGSYDTTYSVQGSPICVRGTFCMEGGSISDNNSVSGGAIYCTETGNAILTGGLIANNHVSSTQGGDGGAMFLAANARATVGGDVLIQGNSSTRSAGAIAMRNGASLSIEGGTITGNNTGGEASEVVAPFYGAVSSHGVGNIASVTLSGSPVIEGNTYKGSTPADLSVSAANTLTVGKLEPGAHIGIYAASGIDATGQQFATGADAATSLGDLSAFFSNTRSVSGRPLMGAAGDGTAIIWENPPICKIASADGASAAVYNSLSAAFSAAVAQGGATIEMLVESYDLTSSLSVGNLAVDVVLTTAKTEGEGCADGYPYEGDAETPCTIRRAFNGGSMVTVGGGGGSLSFAHLVLDGNADASYTGAGGSVISASGGASVWLRDGCIIQNALADPGSGAAATANGGAVALAGQGTTLHMESGAVAQSCQTNGSWGGFLYQGPNTSFIATGGTIRNCGTTIAASSGGAIFANSSCVTELGGDFEAYGNYAYEHGSFWHGFSSTVLRLKGSASIHDNDIKAAAANKEGSALYTYGAIVEIEGSPTVADNRQLNNTECNIHVTAESQIRVTGSLTGGEVGIYFSARSAAGNTFGKAYAGSAETTATNLTGLYHLKNDITAGLSGAPGTGSAVIWATSPICKIVDGGVAATYPTLTDAVAAAKRKGGNVTIEMIVSSYNIGTSFAFGALTGGVNITIATAKTIDEGCADGYPYEGAADAPCVLQRAFAGGSMFTVTGASGGSVSFADIILDGNGGTYTGGSGSVIYGSGGAAIYLKDGCTIRNAKANANGGGAYLEGSGTTLYMESGSLVEDCQTSEVYGGFLYQNTRTSFFATGGTIRNCGTTHASGSGGGVFIQSYCTTDLSGDFKAYGNYARANGSFYHGWTNNSVLRLSGEASVCENKIIPGASGFNGSAIFTYGTLVEIGGSPMVVGNLQADNSTERNIYTTAIAEIKVMGNLTGGEVGIYSTAGYTKGAQFGKAYAGSAETTATNLTGLYRLTNDRPNNQDEKLAGMAGSGSAVVWGVVKDIPVQIIQRVSEPLDHDAWFVVEVRDAGEQNAYRQPVLVRAGQTEGSATVMAKSSRPYSFTDVEQARPWRQGKAAVTYAGPESVSTSAGSATATFTDAAASRTFTFSSSEEKTQWLSDSASVRNAMR